MIQSIGARLGEEYCLTKDKLSSIHQLTLTKGINTELGNEGNSNTSDFSINQLGVILYN